MSNRRKFWTLFVMGLVVIIIVNTIIISTFTPKIIRHLNARIKSEANIAVNDSVYRTLKDFGYTDFCIVDKDSNGKITSIMANNMLLNTLSRMLVNDIAQTIKDQYENGVKIPLGNLTEWPLFVGKGPKIHIGVKPFEEVNCRFVSEFESAGINQTRHKIILLVETSFAIVVPSVSNVVTTTVEVLVAETIIIGDVPQVYFYYTKSNENS
jgi:sporulation protein YunB